MSIYLPFTSSTLQLLEAVAMAINLGVAAGVAWLLIVGAGFGWSRVMDWIDDQPVYTRDNPVIRVLMRALGYTERADGVNNPLDFLWCYWSPTKRQYRSGGTVAMVSAAYIFAAVPVGLILLVLYPLTLLTLLLIAVAFWERQRRRNHKLTQSEEAPNGDA